MAKGLRSGSRFRHMVEPFHEGPIQGFLHSPEGFSDTVYLLGHGAGSNCESRLLVSLCESLSAAGVFALRFDLPFRQKRRTGSPHPSGAALDRQAFVEGARSLRDKGYARVYIGGHSYGGRQASMAAAEHPDTADGLLLLSYPLHPPDRPEQLRTAHFPKIRMPAYFVHGTRDPFGSMAEMQSSIVEIPAHTDLLTVSGAGHDLKRVADQPGIVLDWMGYPGTLAT